MGPARAEDIIEGRPWLAWKELTDIRGIGEGRLNEIFDSDLLCSIDT
ncbi:hypothetical protein [Modicisalibacter ilicicola]|nr:hypothetical protein [Halomonas ilicicola]